MPRSKDKKGDSQTVPSEQAKRIREARTKQQPHGVGGRTKNVGGEYPGLTRETVTSAFFLAESKMSSAEAMGEADSGGVPSFGASGIALAAMASEIMCDVNTSD